MVPRSVRLLLLAVLLSGAGAAMPVAQSGALTVEDIYSYEGWRRLNGSVAATMSWVPSGDPWLSDTHHLWPGESDAESSAGPWSIVEAATGASRPLYTYAQL